MVKNIVRDPMFLQQKSEPATEADKQVIHDLLDTLRANQDRCVGMAANMIGVKKRIIVVAMGPFHFAMVNPVITKKSGEYQTWKNVNQSIGNITINLLPLPGSHFTVIVL